MLEMKFVPVKPVYNGHPWGMARWPLQQGDRHIQVNFAENIRQLKILGSYPVTVIHNRPLLYTELFSEVWLYQNQVKKF